MKHAAHFVPGFKHFPAVDSFQGETLGDDMVPVNLGISGLETKQGHFTSVIHVFDHMKKSTEEIIINTSDVHYGGDERLLRNFADVCLGNDTSKTDLASLYTFLYKASLFKNSLGIGGAFVPFITIFS